MICLKCGINLISIVHLFYGFLPPKVSVGFLLSVSIYGFIPLNLASYQKMFMHMPPYLHFRSVFCLTLGLFYEYFICCMIRLIFKVTRTMIFYILL